MATLDSFCKNDQWPAGPYPVEVRAFCALVEKGLSQKKKTPYVRLWWATEEGAYFSDTIYVVGTAISRLAIVAQRVCNIPKEQELPDDKQQAAVTLAKLIMEKAEKCMAAVTVEEYEEEFMVKDGPDIGQVKKIKKHQVSPFAGYKRLNPVEVQPVHNEGMPTSNNAPPHIDYDQLPF